MGIIYALCGTAMQILKINGQNWSHSLLTCIWIKYKKLHLHPGKFDNGMIYFLNDYDSWVKGCDFTDCLFICSKDEEDEEVLK